jgi:adenylosuccinate synthase
MSSVAIIDLTFGDAGKGSMTDAYVRRIGAKWTVRFNGGAQAAHNVVTPDGRRHVFSQFGSGTLAGAGTFLTRDVLVNPAAMLKEADALRTVGVAHPMKGMYVDRRCRVTTPWHIALNRLRETSRGQNRHGSCGMGIGETMLDCIENPGDTLRVEDIMRPGELSGRLRRIRVRLLEKALELRPSAAAAEHMEWFSPESVGMLYDELRGWSLQAGIVEKPPFSGEDAIVWEGAQGVLLDENFGFHPHTTWSTTTTVNVIQYCKDHNLPLPEFLGLTRSYFTRHGPGPFPTQGEDIAPEQSNKTNRP